MTDDEFKMRIGEGSDNGCLIDKNKNMLLIYVGWKQRGIQVIEQTQVCWRTFAMKNNGTILRGYLKGMKR